MKTITLDLRARDTVAAILALTRRSLIVEAALSNVPELPALWESPEELETSGDSFLGVIGDAALIGYASYRVIDGVLDIQGIVVEPGYARRGVGRALLHALLALPHSRAVALANLANVPLRSLFQRNGFQWVGTSEAIPGVKTLHFSRNPFPRPRTGWVPARSDGR